MKNRKLKFGKDGSNFMGAFIKFSLSQNLKPQLDDIKSMEALMNKIVKT